MKDKKKISISITVNADLLCGIDKYVKDSVGKITRTYAINLAIKRFLESKK